MHSTQLVKVLAVALSTFAVAHASVADIKVGPVAVHEVIKRQGSSSGSGGGGATPTTSTTSSTSSTRSTPTTSSTSSTRTTPTTTPTTPPTTSPTTGSPTTTGPSQTTPPGTTETTPTSQTPSLTTKTEVITTTNSDGVPTTMTSESVSTNTAGLANNNGNTDSGMPESTRNTIIGVVVGVGGAIILGVVGLVAFRIWGRKKQQEDVDAPFGGGYAPADKVAEPAGSTTSRTPFQSTLESYHAPTQVNASSNF